MIPIFHRSIEGFEFIKPSIASENLDFSKHLPLGSLPRLFRTSLASFDHARHPLLLADPRRTAALKEKIRRHGRLVCGISWLSSRMNIGKHKSIALEQLAVALSSSQLQFVDLQYGDTTKEREMLLTQHGIEVHHFDDVDNFSDLDGLAALIDTCDLLITISNSTAHLAGAMGKETLLLLPSGKSKIWYWKEFDGKNPWYPSIRSFTQIKPGSWDEPLQQVKRYIEEKLWS